MQDTDDKNPSAFDEIKDHVAALPEATQAGKDLVAAPPHQRVIDDALTTLFQLCQVARSSQASPRSSGILRDAVEIAFRLK